MLKCALYSELWANQFKEAEAKEVLKNIHEDHIRCFETVIFAVMNIQGDVTWLSEVQQTHAWQNSEERDLLHKVEVAFMQACGSGRTTSDSQ